MWNTAECVEVVQMNESIDEVGRATPPYALEVR
jgi:hypothetical protein